MGNGIVTEAKTIRYMGGKLLPKYFQEDVWPTHELFFSAFNLDSNNAFLVFAHFAKLDKEQKNRILCNECFRAFGVIRSKFTERMFSREFLSGISIVELRGEHFNEDKPIEEYSFKEFLIIVWHYCSLTHSGIARYVFEIFDPDNIGILEKADVEAMYRLLFDTSEHDEKCVMAIYPFDEDDKISKNDFIQYSSTKTKIQDKGQSSKLFSLSGYSFENTDLIWPAIQVQEVLRKTFGGSAGWKSVTSYRERTYSSLESNCDTLPEAIGVILQREQEKIASVQRSAYLLLEATKRRLQEEAEAVQNELRVRELQEERERRKLRATARDTPMNDALSDFEEKRAAFMDTEFTLDDIWERHEARLALFEALDKYVELAKEYREWRREKDAEITEGTPEDLEYRYQDYIKTSEGNKLSRLMVLVHVFRRMQEAIDARKMKKNKGGGNNTSGDDIRSSHEMLVEKYLKELQQLVDSVAPPGMLQQSSSEEKEGEAEAEVDIEPRDLKKRLQRMQERSIEPEQQHAKSKASKGDWVYAESESHAKLSALLKRRTMRQFYKELEASKEEERREYIRRDFELCTSFGSRITKWEYVLDEQNDRMVYVSVDTLEQRHAKTAICEKCDAIIVQHEMRCIICGTLRSAKNQKLFRPLGFKDITLD